MSDEEKERTVGRALVAKAVQFKAGRRKDWVAPRIDDAIRKVVKASPRIALRHHPLRENIQKNSACYFINRASDVPGGGLLLEICVYTHGLVPESMTPDLDRTEAEIRAVELKDDDGKPGELVHSFRCLAFGQIVLIEAPRGLGGPARAFSVLMTSLFRRHLGDTKHPSVDLLDIGSADLRKLIRSRGGVQKVVARLTEKIEPASSRYGKTLSETRSTMGGARRCQVIWEADDKATIDEDAAVDALEEAEDETLAGVTLHFKHGGSVSDLHKYRERRRVYVAALPDGRVSVPAIEKELREYLSFLRDPGFDGPIDSNGILHEAKLVQQKK